MLVRHPSGAARLLRYVLAVPLVAGCALFCSQLASAQKRTKPGSTITRDGNTFMLSQPQTQTVSPSFGDNPKEPQVSFTILPSPMRMNGQKIYEEKELTTPSRYAGPAASASAQLLSAIQKPLSRLPDGPYSITIFTPVISPEGRLVFFDTRGVEYPGTPFDENFEKRMDSLKKFRKPIDPTVKKDIDAAIDEALHRPFQFRPATRKGTAVLSYLERDLDLQFEVRNGIARLTDKP